jgi:endonuclease/exonuclease/phosphatase family metal-dependent hydrolase
MVEQVSMGAPLRILSANLQNGGARPEAFAELVETCGPDAVVVQELAPEQADALARVLPYGGLAPDLKHNGMGIALRRPARLSRLSLVHRNAHLAALEPADWPELSRPVEIVNVHLLAPHGHPAWVQPWRRRRQLQALMAHVEADPERARAVVGDFNATPIWPAYRRLARSLEDLALTHARARGTRPTRTWPRWRGAPFLRIDHCFGSGLVVESFEVVDLPGSDHYAIVVDATLS